MTYHSPMRQRRTRDEPAAAITPLPPQMQYSSELLLATQTTSIWDVVCGGECRHKGAEECPNATYLVFPYRGVFVRHLGRQDAVGEANQVLLFNQTESYRISHPVAGGDASLSLAIREDVLSELAPMEHIRVDAGVAFRHQRLRIDARAQTLVAQLRYRLKCKVAETLEIETLILTLIKRALGERTSHATRASEGLQKLVDRAKLVLSSELARRWTLADIAKVVGVSPVYLTQVFRKVEGMPLYRYQLRLRLARALDLLGEYDDLTALSMHLGFSSHSHFSAAFRQTYGQTPGAFRRSAQPL